MESVGAPAEQRYPTFRLGVPVLFVQTYEGKLRMCIDYRALNKAWTRQGHGEKYVPRAKD
jgi:hypothetical protein